MSTAIDAYDCLEQPLMSPDYDPYDAYSPGHYMETPPGPAAPAAALLESDTVREIDEIPAGTLANPPFGNYGLLVPGRDVPGFRKNGPRPTPTAPTWARPPYQRANPFRSPPSRGLLDLLG